MSSANAVGAEAETPLERLIVERARAFARELEAASAAAPFGGVLDACESAVMGSGRQFLRDALASSLQARADEAEKKGLPAGPAAAAAPSGTRGRPRRKS